MEFTKFGDTGLSVSRLCLGTATFGRQADEIASHAIFDRAAAAGINFIDTGNSYPLGGNFDRPGLTEEITGRWLKGRRGGFIVATKAGFPVGPSPWDRGASRKHLLDAVDASLRRLGTDYVDLYQVHLDDPNTPLDETLSALDSIVRSGKARYVGASNFLAYRLALAIGRSDARSYARFASIQPRYNLLFREIERELLPLATETGLAVIPYNPLAGGMLTGKYKPEDTPETGRFSGEMGRSGQVYQARYWDRRKFEVVSLLRSAAADMGVSLTTLSVSWVLSRPEVTSVILGASKVEHLEDSIAAATVTLDPAMKDRLDEVTAEFRRGDAVR